MRVDELFVVRGLAAAVTGGASGIGLAFAEAMVDNGASVTLLDIDAPRLERAVEGLNRRGGAPARGAVVDVTDRDGMMRAFEEAHAAFGRLDVAFANAGIDPGPGFVRAGGEPYEPGFIENTPEADWDKVLATNLTGVFTTLRAAVTQMKKGGAGGSIIATTSSAAIRNSTFIAGSYPVAKHAVERLVRQAALELSRYNIRVNAVAPGPFNTNIAGGLAHRPDQAAKMKAMVPLGRIAETTEIQGVLLFLASPASSFVTGVQIPVDGGRSLGPL